MVFLRFIFQFFLSLSEGTEKFARKHVQERRVPKKDSLSPEGYDTFIQNVFLPSA